MSRRVFAAFVGIATLSLAEGLARLLPPPSAAAGAWRQQDAAPEGILLDGSPWFLWELSPGTHREFGVSVSINSVGLRGPEPGEKSRPRVMAVGDSSIYGFGVADSEVFTARLGAPLQADVINAGVPGYSTFQTLNLLDARALALEPDLLLIGNLWSDNSFDTFVDRDLLAAYTGWTLSPTQRVRSVLERSSGFRWLDWGLRVRGHAVEATRVGWTVGRGGDPMGKRRVGIEDYAANLDAMVERLRDRGGSVVFVLLANREDILHGEPLPAWEPYRSVMRETAARWGAPTVDVPAAFVASGLDVDALFLDLMHPSAVGHQLLAEAVLSTLGGWPQTPIVLRAPSPRPVYSDPFIQREAPSK